MPLTSAQISERLKGMYRAKDCCDSNDCEYVIKAINEMAERNNNEMTPAMQKRYFSVLSKQMHFVANGDSVKA